MTVQLNKDISLQTGHVRAIGFVIALFGLMGCCSAEEARPPQSTISTDGLVKTQTLPLTIGNAGQAIEDNFSKWFLGPAFDLPDGSQLKTVWPAALHVRDYSLDDKAWKNQPIRDACEPAVYSLARVRPDGTAIWVKNYFHLAVKPFEDCDSYRLGFEVWTRLHDLGGKLSYALPFQGVIDMDASVQDQDPYSVEPKMWLHLDVNTGNLVGDVPKNVRAIDAYELRSIKEKIALELNRLFPEPELPINGSSQSWKEFGRIRSSHERSRHQLFYKQLEAALF